MKTRELLKRCCNNCLYYGRIENTYRDMSNKISMQKTNINKKGCLNLAVYFYNINCSRVFINCKHFQSKK